MLKELGEPSWGARINTGVPQDAKDCPLWAIPHLLERWMSPGLILWDHAFRQITRITAGQALRLLDHLRKSHDWKRYGLIVGEPVVGASLITPKHGPVGLLINRMSLNAAKTGELLELLQRHEAALQQLAADEKESYRQVFKMFDKILGAFDVENRNGVAPPSESDPFL